MDVCAVLFLATDSQIHSLKKIDTGLVCKEPGASLICGIYTKRLSRLICESVSANVPDR